MTMIFNELAGSRIRLINPSLDYLENIHEYSLIPQLYDYLEYRPFKTVEETRAFVKRLIATSDNVTGHYWFIYHLEDKKVIGTIGLVDIDERKGSAELGYGLSPDYWKNGFFSEALQLVIESFFDNPASNRLFIKTVSKNASSINSVSKMGFQQEGILREYYLDFKTGERWDATLLSMLRSDQFN